MADLEQCLFCGSLADAASALLPVCRECRKRYVLRTNQARLRPDKNLAEFNQPPLREKAIGDPPANR